MINHKQIEQLNRTIAEITEIYNQKIEEIINFAKEQRNNRTLVTLNLRDSPPILVQIQKGNLSPESSTFTQIRLSTCSNTPTSSDSPNRSVSPIENQQHIQNRSNNNNNSESEKEESNEEDQDIEKQNLPRKPEPQLIAERNITIFVTKPSKFSGTPNEDVQKWLQEFLVVAKVNR
ncbi:hypothetical protein Glove_236g62 [Diversispora epigaea]|uniref:Uncharacterized protein n=1 Tax=Diversispora epigaea TaxID=1348612 RepID=A0A397ID62_9GLOM|nr:hypothetical protein Glove_236g62 [Diversispora epigaea]